MTEQLTFIFTSCNVDKTDGGGDDNARMCVCVGGRSLKLFGVKSCA